MTLTCPHCGVNFEPHDPRQKFCTSAHLKAFYTLMRKRGVMMVPLVLVWRAGKSRKRGTVGHGLGTYAFATLCRLADLFNEEDRAAGRDPGLLIDAKRRKSWDPSDVVFGRKKPNRREAPTEPVQAD